MESNPHKYILTISNPENLHKINTINLKTDQKPYPESELHFVKYIFPTSNKTIIQPTKIQYNTLPQNTLIPSETFLSNSPIITKQQHQQEQDQNIVTIEILNSVNNNVFYSKISQETKDIKDISYKIDFSLIDIQAENMSNIRAFYALQFSQIFQNYQKILQRSLKFNSSPFHLNQIISIDILQHKLYLKVSKLTENSIQKTKIDPFSLQNFNENTFKNLKFDLDFLSIFKFKRIFFYQQDKLTKLTQFFALLPQNTENYYQEQLNKIQNWLKFKENQQQNDELFGHTSCLYLNFKDNKNHLTTIQHESIVYNLYQIVKSQEKKVFILDILILLQQTQLDIESFFQILFHKISQIKQQNSVIFFKNTQFLTEKIQERSEKSSKNSDIYTDKKQLFTQIIKFSKNMLKLNNVVILLSVQEKQSNLNQPLIEKNTQYIEFNLPNIIQQAFSQQKQQEENQN